MRNEDDIKEQFVRMEKYLPIAYKQEVNHDTYLEQLALNLLKCVDAGAYQFAYFSAYLIFMSYVNYTAWTIAKIMPSRYLDAMIGLKPYKQDDANKFLDIEELKVYSFGLMAEKDVMKLFALIGYNISSLTKFVDARNEIAHASGNTKANTLDDLYLELHAMIKEMEHLSKAKQKLIEEQYLLKMQEFVYSGYVAKSEYEAFVDSLIYGYEISFIELSHLKELSYKKFIRHETDFEEKSDRAKSAKSNIQSIYDRISREVFNIETKSQDTP